MIETLISTPEFEQNPTREIEQKFLPIFPEQLADLRHQARPIEQYYLSHPSEDFSLRLRETIDENGELRYTATLKDRGIVDADGLERLEVETSISPELYQRYRTEDTPILRKLRAHPNRTTAVDFYDDGRVMVESEDPIGWTHFTEHHGDRFIDISGDRQADNEWRAHLHYRQHHDGNEALLPAAELSPDEIVRDIMMRHNFAPQTFVQIGGRSGSGKSTLVAAIREQLDAYAIPSTIVSTDDYHRGATWLREHNGGVDWTAWDDAIVYDTASMANDLRRLQLGETLPRRTIDFRSVEPCTDGILSPSPVMIIEGIYARSADFDQLDALKYEVQTPLATCIGRRIVRDLRERPQFTAEGNLLYMLEQGEPMYQNQLNNRQ